MITLRDYQQESVQIALEFLNSSETGNIPIIVQPTGAGKSILIAYIANELKEDVLVLQPTIELLGQNYAKYRLYGGEASIYSASAGKKEIGKVTFATIGSIKNKASDFEHVKYIIIDECHLVPPISNSMYVKFISQLPGVKCLGVTATPFRLKSYVHPFTGAKYSQINLLTRERPKFFNKFLHITQISELYEKDFLTKPNYLPLEWKDSALVYNSTGAEFSDDSVDKAIKEQMVYERLPLIVKQAVKKGRKHILVFVKSINDAMELAGKTPDSACIHSGTEKYARDIILLKFKAGLLKTVYNVGVLTVGFDFPELDTIIIARPTMSLSLYMQMIGRGIRKADGKIDCAVVDCCGNYNRFGKLEDIKFVTDANDKWVVMQGDKILSGVPLIK